MDRRVKQEGPNRGELATEMHREALHVGDWTGPAEPVRQARDEMTLCDGEIACTSRAKVVRG
jgi:hypothetical protein